MADDDAAHSEHFLDHLQAQRKTEIVRDCATDDLGWKTMAAIERISGLFHVPR